ncbi:DinB family protein [Muricauda sp. HICW]|uniref:DinB family protein n=1 Tax=Flagellimonas chongwuensis TaxID=2697365 RepID=A0A850NJM4_9FLAO|nr:DinB family protein [Allomuricauda chongwuensis]NVN18548.1 DinB family protein [Allomuricauda chongwuensis]
MKGWVFLLVIGVFISCAQNKNDENIRELLLSQLKNTHNTQEWFAPTETALKGLTYEQAIWQDSTANHSIAELATHIVFWNEMNLKSFNDLEISDKAVKNDETFQVPKKDEWSITVKRLDSIQTEWKTAVKHADLVKIQDRAEEIANMSAHTGYHTGQIVYIRKQNGWWK